MVQGTYTWLKDSLHGGPVQSTSGYDIIFTTDAAGTSPLACERAHWDGSTGDVQFWINVPSLTAGANYTFYVQYGNAAIITNQCIAANVWTPSGRYKGVYHMFETTGPYADSTSNANNSTGGTYPSATTGLFGTAQSFSSGSTNYIQFTNPVTTLASTITFSCWVKTSSSGATKGIASNSNSGIGLDFYMTSTGLAVAKFVGGGGTTTTSAAAINDNAWHYVAGNLLNTGFLDVWVDGTPHSQTLFSGGDNAPGNMYLGVLHGLASYFDGLIEEFRVSNVDPTVNWNLTEIHNQGDVTTFYTIGSPVSAGGVNVFPILF